MKRGRDPRGKEKEEIKLVVGVNSTKTRTMNKGKKGY